ncbi:hypothetical protein RISK_002610 [Rhodopirellula islandica]|uniref:Uncharacterized protein n=1 Tax=Rhodopirellula islandica TaxID=595434 RepID=A0A0J1BFT9_RHOIS|nr:hypothetical protein RISK_002610 [Rhodopirellula islandica]
MQIVGKSVCGSRVHVLSRNSTRIQLAKRKVDAISLFLEESADAEERVVLAPPFNASAPAIRLAVIVSN